MNCPICSQESVVLKTEGVRRRRKCSCCGHRFTTIELLSDEQARQAEALKAVLDVAEKLKAAA